MSKLLNLLERLNEAAARVATPVSHVFLLALRVHVSWQFLKSGWLKLQDWDSTLYLFTEEYRVPLASPGMAAMLGTAGEIAFPVLLVAGVATRYSALGLSAVNAVAVIAYAHVLTSEGFEAALGQHWLWGLMLATLVVFGGGRLSVDGIAGRAAPSRRTAGMLSTT
jgi:putative oxidoreductase